MREDTVSAISSQDGTLEFEGDGDRLVSAWNGPPDSPPGELRDRVRLAFDTPIEFPPLRHVVVPGDRVVVPFDRTLPDADVILGVMVEVLGEIGVESITAIVDGRTIGPSLAGVEGVTVVVHDPTDRESLAYLANTEAGRRIYLNRLIADADCVIPIGRLGYGAGDRYLGPWSVIEPGLADTAAKGESLVTPGRSTDLALAESSEVSWLLGSHFQVAGLPGRTGLLRIIAGEAKAVQATGRPLLDDAWRFQVEDRADLVIAGVGGPGRSVIASGFADALRTGLRLVRRGGKLVLLSKLDLGTIREAIRVPGQPRDDWDKALAWADIYLASEANADSVDDLGIIPIDRPEQAVKLARASASYITVGQVDRTLASVD